ncbi:MAG: hypothetical protein NTV01_20215 [Bacteroidia bacterium]|nr:hypothetical protein [Bacteroidia bacterium]
MIKEQLDNLIQQIRGLKQKKIFLSTKHYVTKEKYYQSFSAADKSELENLEKEISDIDKQLQPLLTQFQANSNKYVVDYEGEFTDINGLTYWHSYREILNFRTSCNIDTFTNGWGNSIQDCETLLQEIIDFLFYYRFTNFRITNVKKI